MKFVQALCETITRALGLSALSPWAQDSKLQQSVGLPEGDIPRMSENLFPTKTSTNVKQDEGISLQYEKLPSGRRAKAALPDGPIFSPPNSSPGFLCDYTAMKGWRHTGGVGMRTSWLEKPIGDDDATGGIYNIFTNYDQYSPIGTVRKVGQCMAISCSGCSRCISALANCD